MQTLRAGLLGATGTIGQRFISLLGGPHESKNPRLRLVALGASERSINQEYKNVAKWKLSEQIPPGVGEMIIRPCTPAAFSDCDIVFSGLDADVAGDIETEFAANGFAVFTNAKNHRYDPHVPILLPTVNPEHIEAVKHQPTYKKSGGFIIANPNCASAGIAAALAPLHREYGIKEVFVATLQAVSGAGYPGLSFYDIHDNVIPFINGEEEKIEAEPLKILGSFDGSAFQEAKMCISAHCHRVPVIDGHTASVSVKLEKAPPTTPEGLDIERVTQLFRGWNENIKTAVGDLPSAPEYPLLVDTADDRPQPRLDRMRGGGYAVSVGRLRPCSLYDVKFVCLCHNTVLGGAGGSVLNAEFAAQQDLIKIRRSLALP